MAVERLVRGLQTKENGGRAVDMRKGRVKICMRSTGTRVGNGLGVGLREKKLSKTRPCFWLEGS